MKSLLTASRASVECKRCLMNLSIENRKSAVRRDRQSGWLPRLGGPNAEYLKLQPQAFAHTPRLCPGPAKISQAVGADASMQRPRRDPKGCRREGVALPSTVTKGTLFLCAWMVGMLGSLAWAGTVRWISGSGDWGDASKWSTGVVPGTNDDAVIDTSDGAITVTISSGIVQVNSIQCQETLLLNGGTVLGGTILTTNGASFVVQSGRLDGVTVDGELDVGRSVNSAALTVADGLVLNGTAYVGSPTNGNYGAVSFTGNQVLGGNGTVVFGSYGNPGADALRLANSGTTLVIGAGVMVRGQNGTIGYSDWYGGPQDVGVVNQGTISADVSGGTIVIRGSSLSNVGELVESASGGTLSVPASTVNTGFVKAEHGEITFSVGFTQNVGILGFGLGGPSDFGRINLSGKASVGGTLEADVEGGYLPNVGDSFAVLDYGTNLVGFTNANLPTVAAWETNYSQGVLTLVVKGLLPLGVTVSPTNQTVSVGSTVTFQAAASGPGPFGYQWRLNGAALAGATNATLALSNVTAEASGDYTVQVSNGNGSTLSGAAVLTVLGPPEITAEPQSRMASVGTTVTFRVGVTGSPPLSYQWSFNGSALPGATGASLILTNVTRAEAGDYSVAITNAIGSTASAPAAVLTIATGVACPGTPPGMVAWWQGEGNTGDYAGTNDAVFEGAVAYGPGEVGQAFAFDGASSYLQVPNNPLWALGANDFTIELWANFSAVYASTPAGDGSTAFIGQDEGPGPRSKWFFGFGGGTLYFYIRGASVPPLFLAQAPFNPSTNRWYHLAVTRSGSLYQIYVNGVVQGAETNDLAVPAADAPLTIGQVQYLFMDGLLDEISLYNRALSPNEIQAIYQVGTQGKCGLESGSGIRLQAVEGADGKVTILIDGGQAGATLTVEATSDFKQWTPIGQITKGQGPAVFNDPTANLPPWRFYRVITNP